LWSLGRINLLIIVIKEKLINISLNKPIEKNDQRLREEIYSTRELEITPELDQVSKTSSVNLTQPTMAQVREFFNNKTSHRPSEEMYEALSDIALTLEDMANGKAENKIHLSSLAPGIGKTQTICIFLNLLLKNEDYRDQGILICLSTYDEIESYMDKMEVDQSNRAILTSEHKLNRLGNPNHNDAQVLFTTQQRMYRRLKQYENFSKADEFFYKGKPRQIRIWDESFLPGDPIVTRRDDLLFLIGALRNPCPEFTAELDELLNKKLLDVKGESLLELPDLIEKHGLDLNKLTGILKQQNRNKEDVDAASNFWFLLGRSVSVGKDGMMGCTALSYDETIPDDISPLLVLDASGSYRATYEEMASHRKNIIRLKVAHKDHSDLEIHHWVTGGGKLSFIRRTDEYIEGIANTINEEPDKEWLIIIHKDMELENRIRPMLEKADQGNIHFINWGKHRSTNKYSQADRVILAGTLYLSGSQHESLGRLSAGKLPEHGEYPEEAINRVALGELKHIILQGACRGAVRLCEGNKCKPCKVFIMGAKKSGVKPELFQELFPKSTYHLWRPITRELTGKVKAAMDYLIQRFDDPEVEYVSFREVMKAIGYITIVDGKEKYDSANFSKNIRQHREFDIALYEAVLEETSRGTGRMNGFAKSLLWEDISITGEPKRVFDRNVYQK
jgi:hypothetical protein